MNESFELDIPMPEARARIRALNTLNFCAELNKIVWKAQERCRLTLTGHGDLKQISKER